MRALVTGCAGFVGSHLTEQLVTRGDAVIGVDSFTDYYEPAQKRANLEPIEGHPRFDLVEADLMEVDVGRILDGVDVVFHLAAQPGVRSSWGRDFAMYVRQNLSLTQRLLEAVVDAPGLQRFVYASSSSVYGEPDGHPTAESQPTIPRSPYGVTKLAAEHLCNVYAENWAVPTVSLRYFTVYGSRQRPDMAIHRLVEAAVTGTPFTIYGDGSQIRDFTHVSDVVRANLAAVEADAPPGLVANVAGGSSVSLWRLVELIQAATGRDIPLVRGPEQPGDVRRTGGATDVAARELSWTPRTGLDEGLEEQCAWHIARAEGSLPTPKAGA